MMGSNDRKSKSIDELAAGQAGEGPVAQEGRGEKDTAEVVSPAADKPKPARFDFARANQAHLKSMAAMRGRNAGPVKKGPTRR